MIFVTGCLNSRKISVFQRLWNVNATVGNLASQFVQVYSARSCIASGLGMIFPIVKQSVFVGQKLLLLLQASRITDIDENGKACLTKHETHLSLLESRPWNIEFWLAPCDVPFWYCSLSRREPVCTTSLLAKWSWTVLMDCLLCMLVAWEAPSFYLPIM